MTLSPKAEANRRLSEFVREGAEILTLDDLNRLVAAVIDRLAFCSNGQQYIEALMTYARPEALRISYEAPVVDRCELDIAKWVYNKWPEVLIPHDIDLVFRLAWATPGHHSAVYANIEYFSSPRISDRVRAISGLRELKAGADRWSFLVLGDIIDRVRSVDDNNSDNLGSPELLAQIFADVFRFDRYERDLPGLARISGHMKRLNDSYLQALDFYEVDVTVADEVWHTATQVSRRDRSSAAPVKEPILLALNKPDLVDARALLFLIVSQRLGAYSVPSSAQAFGDDPRVRERADAIEAYFGDIRADKPRPVRPVVKAPKQSEVDREERILQRSNLMSALEGKDMTLYHVGGKELRFVGAARVGGNSSVTYPTAVFQVDGNEATRTSRENISPGSFGSVIGEDSWKPIVRIEADLAQAKRFELVLRKGDQPTLRHIVADERYRDFSFRDDSVFEGSYAGGVTYNDVRVRPLTIDSVVEVKRLLQSSAADHRSAIASLTHNRNRSRLAKLTSFELAMHFCGDAQPSKSILGVFNEANALTALINAGNDLKVGDKKRAHLYTWFPAASPRSKSEVALVASVFTFERMREADVVCVLGPSDMRAHLASRTATAPLGDYVPVTYEAARQALSHCLPVAGATPEPMRI